MPEQAGEPARRAADSFCLRDAFVRFQRHCEQLENVHDALRAQLDRRVEEIERMKEQLADILESITDAVILVDSDGSVEVANGAARRLFGTLNSPRSMPGLERLLDADTSLRDEEMEIRLPSGDRRVIATAVPKAGAAGRPGARVLAIKDVTEHHLLQERLRRAHRMAELGRMAASVAHQIRNPLTGVEGFAQLLERDLRDTDPRASHMAERIVQAARRVGEVVSNMTYYADQPPRQETPADLSLIARNAIEIIYPWATDIGVGIALDAPDEPVITRCDAAQLTLAIGNLLANALEACRDQQDGRIHVQVTADSDAARLEIQDNGVGIPEDAVARVREPFFSLNEHGLGLGLAVADRLMEAHGGRLRVASAAGRGTTIALDLPRR
jgi:signal transduction histidine kinase